MLKKKNLLKEFLKLHNIYNEFKLNYNPYHNNLIELSFLQYLNKFSHSREAINHFATWKDSDYVFWANIAKLWYEICDEYEKK